MKKMIRVVVAAAMVSALIVAVPTSGLARGSQGGGTCFACLQGYDKYEKQYLHMDFNMFGMNSYQPGTQGPHWNEAEADGKCSEFHIRGYNLQG